MKVICINNSTGVPNTMRYQLTINKWYDVIHKFIDTDNTIDYYWIKNDIDGISPYDSKLFLTKNQQRKQKLSKLCGQLQNFHKTTRRLK